MKLTAHAIAVILLAGGWLLSVPACSQSDTHEQDGHEPDEHDEALWLEDREIAEFGIEIANAEAGTLLVEVESPVK